MHQRFTRRLSITPFGLPLSQFIETAEKTILNHHQKGNLFSRDQNGTRVPLGLDTDTPLWKWDGYDKADENGTLVNFPTSFTKEHHGGKTKKELLEEESLFPGFLVSFIEEGPIPRNGKGETKGGRKQLEAGQSPNQYLMTLQTNETYQGESGLTIEEWLTHFITHLEETGEVIDDRDGNGSGSWNLGSYFSSDGTVGLVSVAYWYRDDAQAIVTGSDPSNEYGNNGSRFVVRVGMA